MQTDGFHSFASNASSRLLMSEENMHAHIGNSAIIRHDNPRNTQVRVIYAAFRATDLFISPFIMSWGSRPAHPSHRHALMVASPAWIRTILVAFFSRHSMHGKWSFTRTFQVNGSSETIRLVRMAASSGSLFFQN
jgi:hypothetical protein